MTQTPRKIIHRGYQQKNLIEVTDHGDHRSLYFASRYLQSRMSLSRPFDLILPYTQYMLFSLLFDLELKNVLVVGIGAGSMIRFLHHHFPEYSLDCVDNSEHVIELAKGYFQLPESRNLSIHCMDGIDFIRNCSTSYDLILVDAFDGAGMAPGIYTNPFFKYCRRAMNPLGILSCNLWSSKTNTLREIKTSLGEQFTTLLTLPVPERGNIIIHSMNYPPPWKKICRRKKDLSTLSNQYNINFRQMVQVARQNNLYLANFLSALFH